MKVSLYRHGAMGALLLTGLMGGYSETARGQAAEAWVQRLSGGGGAAVAVDNDGNVIVAGASGVGGAADYATIKYSAAGVALWTNRYDGPAGGEDLVRGLVVDGSGKVFVTGNSSQLPGSSSFTDIATIAYSKMGEALWTNRYSGGTVAAATTDGNGNLHLAGYYGAGSGSDYLTLKFSGTGTLLWTNRYNAPANGVDIATAMAVDGGGNVLVTGFSAKTNGIYDYLTIKCSSNGVALWDRRYAGPLGGPNLASAVAVDGSGNVFVTGDSYQDLSYHYATIAYSTTGSPLWTNCYYGPTSDDDRAAAVAVDTNGNVFVTGYSFGFSYYDFATIKYANNGVPLWTNRYNGPATGDERPNDQATALAVDHSGNVLVTGSSSATNGSPDYATIMYSNAGVALWTNRYNGPANGPDRPSSLAVGLDGAVYVTGASDGDFSRGGISYDFATVKYVSTTASPVSLHIEKVADQVVLIWTNVDFDLQFTPAVTGLFTSIPGAISPYTNPITTGSMYFRLKANNP